VRENMGELSNIIINAIEEGRKRSLEDKHLYGYDLAAGICTGVIDEKINELNVRMGTGNFLSDNEQYFLGQLHEIKKEITHELLIGESVILGD